MMKSTLGSYEIFNHSDLKVARSRRLKTNGQRIQKCTVVVPYVDKSVYYTQDSEMQSLTFENWMARKYHFGFIGRFTQNYSSYRFRFLLASNLKLLDNLVLDANQTQIHYHNSRKLEKLNYVFAASSNSAHKTKIYWPICEDPEADQIKNCILSSAEYPNRYMRLLTEHKFGLLIYGDTPSSGRLYDLISSGTIPIIFSNYLLRDGLPFFNKVPYYKFCYFIDDTLPVKQVYQALIKILLETSEAEYQEKYENLKLYAKEILWRRADSRVIENILVETAYGCNTAR